MTSFKPLNDLLRPRQNSIHFTFGMTILMFLLTGWSQPEFTPCSPVSDQLTDQYSSSLYVSSEADAPTLDFCAEWNPEFPLNGHHCCTKLGGRNNRKKGAQKGAQKGGGCFAARRKTSFCSELTQEQQEYIGDVISGKVQNVLSVISREMGRAKDQAYCTVNNGFLARGRPIVPTSKNRIELRSPARCTSFGTDGMAGMLEWVGHGVATYFANPSYSGVHFVIGDVSAPRGGCLPGRAGRRGHASHTSGQDVDLGYLTVKEGARSPSSFHTHFDAQQNWWLIKQIFKNPFVCIKVIFLDKSHIRKLRKIAKADEDWEKFSRFIRHVRGHKNHMHVRVGDWPGQPGCVSDAKPELELPDDEIGDEMGDELADEGGRKIGSEIEK